MQYILTAKKKKAAKNVKCQVNVPSLTNPTLLLYPVIHEILTRAKLVYEVQTTSFLFGTARATPNQTRPRVWRLRKFRNIYLGPGPDVCSLLCCSLVPKFLTKPKLKA